MIRLQTFKKEQVKRTLRRALSLVLAVCICSGGFFAFAESAPAYGRDNYEKALMAKGFPQDYAEKLAELKLAHPTWNFEPLLVSELDSRFVFEYIIDKETKKPDINLVYDDKQFEAFFDPDNNKKYDNGHWRSPSRAAVEYFMDPRNFLNERDIFQFEDLGYGDRDYETGVRWIISDTFMDGMILESGVSMMEYILEVGKELSVSPVHIAARIRQEQGVGGKSDMISGLAGDRLLYYYENKIYENEDGGLVNAPASGHTPEGLLSYNGYYNFFNIGASGTGMFYIYLNGMKKAKTGTPEMASEWGGSAAWNTREKAIYGGVYVIKTNYIDYYQSTPYLQKFCVDPRSPSPFAHQYMQNVSGALTEGRNSYRSYKEAGLLESELTFLIPVYEGLPEQPCPDLTEGKSTLSPTADGVSYVTYSNYPYKAGKNQDLETSGEVSVDISEKIRVQGWSVHTLGTETYEISVDGGAFESIKSYPRLDVQQNYGTEYPLSLSINAYQHYIDASVLGAGVHTITVRARTTVDSYYPVSNIKVTVTDGNGDLDGDGDKTSTDLTMLLRYLAGHEIVFSGNLDLNGDGKINNRDLIELLNVLEDR